VPYKTDVLRKLPRILGIAMLPWIWLRCGPQHLYLSVQFLSKLPVHDARHHVTQVNVEQLKTLHKLAAKRGLRSPIRRQAVPRAGRGSRCCVKRLDGRHPRPRSRSPWLGRSQSALVVHKVAQVSPRTVQALSKVVGSDLQHLSGNGVAYTEDGAEDEGQALLRIKAKKHP
jgi:hypothetical protein